MACFGLAAPAADPEPKNVYLVLRTDAKETDETVRRTLKKALKLAGATADEPLPAKQVSAAFFAEFQALVDKVGVPTDAKDPHLRLLPTAETVYELKLTDAQVLKELRVTYQKGGTKKYTPVAPGGKGPLVWTLPGRYAFTPDAGDVPLNYEADVAELGKDDAALKRPWPKADKYFVVTMKNFRGSQKELFAVLEDAKNWPNAFAVEKLQNDMVFAFASLKSEAARRRGGRIGQDNTLTFSIDRLERDNQKRVWVRFPLTADELAKEVKRFEGQGGDKLSEAIRKDGPSAATEAATIDPVDKGPRWYELTQARPGQPLERQVKLANIPGLATKYPKVWMLVVWEFDDGKTAAEAIQTQDDKGNPVFVVEQELGDWGADLKKAAPAPKP